MLNELVQNWWMLLVRGVCAIIFGVLAFIWPGLTLFSLVLLYGIYAFADGITSLVLALSGPHGGRPWGGMLIVGLLGIAAGLVTFFWPGITTVVLLLVIASWSILRGIFEIVAAVRLRKTIEHEWLLALSGVASIVFGGLLLARPAAGALALIWVIGSFAIVFGVLSIALSLRLHGMKRRFQTPGTGGAMPRPS